MKTPSPPYRDKIIQDVLAKEDQISKLRASIEVVDKMIETTKPKTTKKGTKKVFQEKTSSVEIEK